MEEKEERKKKERRTIMPSLVATTSTPARKPFVHTHYVRTNNICVSINMDHGVYQPKKVVYEVKYHIIIKSVLPIILLFYNNNTQASVGSKGRVLACILLYGGVEENGGIRNQASSSYSL